MLLKTDWRLPFGTFMYSTILYRYIMAIAQTDNPMRMSMFYSNETLMAQTGIFFIISLEKKNINFWIVFRLQCDTLLTWAHLLPSAIAFIRLFSFHSNIIRKHLNAKCAMWSIRSFLFRDINTYHFVVEIRTNQKYKCRLY